DIYEGEFKNGAFEGQGTVVYAKARADGRTEARGLWRDWRLLDDPEPRQAGLAVERALLTQRRLLDDALATLTPGRRCVIDMYLLAIASGGSQAILRRQTKFV